MGVTVVKEKKENGTIVQTVLDGAGGVKSAQLHLSGRGARHLGRIYVVDLLTRVFLPAGYPNSVSPDYLRYQVLNALQAFCNSLASLLSSRAILQGFGVGDPTASATKALLLTVLQDVFGRLTTILSAHFIGSSLYPEAKTYRLLADILNDTAVILDTLSPYFNTFSIPGLRVGSLCVSAIFKSLCGICAGGSKAAITMHFASPLQGKGDVGDLNAKDASKETVLALLGMLLGTLIVPYLTTPLTTYTSLFILVGLHLTINYYGVRGLVMRSLNRQRLGLLWSSYTLAPSSAPLTPAEVAQKERIFDASGVIRHPNTGVALGQCRIGTSFANVAHGADFPPPSAAWLDVYASDKYLIWFDRRCLRKKMPLEKGGVGGGGASAVHGFIRLHVVLKEGYTREDQLCAWLEAVEICTTASASASSPPSSSGHVRNVDPLEMIRRAHEAVSKRREEFVKGIKAAGWVIDDCAVMVGLPDSVIVDVVDGVESADDKKTR